MKINTSKPIIIGLLFSFYFIQPIFYTIVNAAEDSIYQCTYTCNGGNVVAVTATCPVGSECSPDIVPCPSTNTATTLTLACQSTVTTPTTGTCYVTCDNGNVVSVMASCIEGNSCPSDDDSICPSSGITALTLDCKPPPLSNGKCSITCESGNITGVQAMCSWHTSCILDDSFCPTTGTTTLIRDCER